MSDKESEAVNRHSQFLDCHKRWLQTTDSPLEPVRWSTMDGRIKARLWEAVALSMDYSPTKAVQHHLLIGAAQPAQQASTDDGTQQTRPRLSGDNLLAEEEIDLLERLRKNSGFMRRLKVAIDHMGAASQDERTVVFLADFSALAQRMGWALPEQFPRQSVALPANLVTPVAPAPASKPAVVDGGNWKMRIQTAAAERWIELRKRNTNPTVSSILPDMVKWCRENDVLTDGGITPSEGYLRTHVLGGKHWTAPTR